MIYISNAFSLQMLDEADLPVQPIISALSPEAVANEILGNEWTTAVGHPDMAMLITKQLGIVVLENRINVTLKPGDALYVAQVVGGRLPAGCTELPEGTRIAWRRVVLPEVYEGGSA